MGGFHRPHPPLQPIEQRYVVREAAEEGLAQMNVSLDEAREKVGAAGVDARVPGPVRFRADRHNTSIPIPTAP